MSVDSVYSEFCELYDQAWNVWSPFYAEADLDLRFYAGDQWDAETIRKLRMEGREVLTFNRSASVIDMIEGYQRQHRTSSVVTAIGDEDEQSASQHNRVLLHNERVAQSYNYLSDAFAGALRSGWNMLTLYMDRREDQENGDIQILREPYNAFICDPFFSRLDWSDCAYVSKRRYLNAHVAASLVPKHSKDVLEIGMKSWQRDSKFSWLPWAAQTETQDVVAYTELWRQDWESKPYMIDRVTGNKWDWNENPEMYSEVIRRYEQRFAKVDRQVKRVRRDVMINDVTLRTDYNPDGLNEYPFVPVVCKFIPEVDDWSLRVQSLMRCMRDPQQEANKRRSQNIDLIESAINTGYFAEEDSIINPKALYQTGQNKVIWNKKGQQPPIPIPPPQIPPGHFQISDQMDRDIMEIAGANDAAFGRAESAQESGILQLIKQSAAVVNLQGVMDRFRFAQQCLAQKMIKLAQTWSPEKIQRIIGEAPVPQFYDPNIARYDIAIQEGIQTDTQRQQYFRQLVELSQMGVPVPPDELLRSAPIQGKNQLNEVIEQQQKAQAEQAQKQAQVEQQLMESQAMLAQSQSMYNMAGAEERYTRADSNEGLEDERQSRAVQQEMDAALKQVQALKELQGMDLENAIRGLSLIKELQQQASAQADVKEMKSEGKKQRTILPRQQIGQAPEPGRREIQGAPGLPQESQEGQVNLL